MHIAYNEYNINRGEIKQNEKRSIKLINYFLKEEEEEGNTSSKKSELTVIWFLCVCVLQRGVDAIFVSFSFLHINLIRVMFIIIIGLFDFFFVLFKNQIKEDSPTHFTHLLFILSFREKRK